MTGNDIRTILSQNIKYLRRFRSFSQADLAEKAGISINFLSNIERGMKWPYPDTLANIAKALKVEIFDLFKPDQKLDDIGQVKVDKLINDITISVESAIKKAYLQYIKK